MTRFFKYLCLFNIAVLFAQRPDIDKDFAFVQGATDTLYTTVDRDFAKLTGDSNLLLVFETKEALFAYFNSHDDTGGINEYAFSEEKNQDLYISKKPISNKEYMEFCMATLRKGPVHDKNALPQPITNLYPTDLSDYCTYLEELWGVPVNIAYTKPGYSYTVPDDGYYISITAYNWGLKLIYDKLNGYLEEAYGNKPPIFFKHDGVHTNQNTILPWVDIATLLVDRNTGKATLKSFSGNDVVFSFNNQQYSSIASLHVHFLADQDKILYK